MFEVPRVEVLRPNRRAAGDRERFVITPGVFRPALSFRFD